MLTMPFKKNNLISIDIGFKNIKVVEVEVGKNNSIFIKNFGIAATPKDCIKNGAIKDVLRVTDAIRKVIGEHNVKAKQAKIVMSGTNIISRVFMTNRFPHEDLDTVMKNTIAEYMPIDMTEHQVDYKVLQETKEGDITQVKFFVTAVLKKIIQSYIDILVELELKPLSVDIPANSTAKFFNREIKVRESENWYKKKLASKTGQDTFAVIDFGSETTIVNILKNQVLEFNKVILRGSSNLDESIASSLATRLEEAERLKKIHGLDDSGIHFNDDQGKIFEAAKNTIEVIAKQIYQCFEYYETRCFGEKVGKIYIIGGGSLLRGLREYLEEVFRVPVYPVGLLSIDGIELNKGLDGEKLNFLINSVGVTL